MPKQQGQGLHNIGSVTKVTNHTDKRTTSSAGSAQGIALTERQEFGVGAGGGDPTARVSSHGTGK